MASIEKRGDNYRITVSCGYAADGSKIRERATFRPDRTKTEKQNQKALEKFVYEFEQRVTGGKYLDGEKITFQAFAEKWLSEYAMQHLEKTTFTMYSHMISAHINPRIGHLKLSKVQPAHLNSLYLELSKTRTDGKEGGYSGKTIRHVHTVISSVFATAVQWNICTENPCARVKPPTSAQRDNLKHFTLDETKTFLSALNEPYADGKQLSEQLALFFTIAVFSGCRRGEILALEWSDIDFNKNLIRINKSTTVAGNEVITKQPKTRGSVRNVPLPDSVMHLAKHWKVEQQKKRLAIGSKWEGSNYVFIQWNGKQMHPDTPYNAFKAFLKRYNATHDIKLPEIPLHGLRHTSATLLITQNTDIKTVSHRLGHSRTSTTLDIYSHSLEKTERAAAETLDHILNAKKTAL